jgi:apolipoprotein N-acyltransferase
MTVSSQPKRFKLLLSLITGITLGLAYPPLPAGFLATICFVPFFMLLEKLSNPREVIKYSYITFLSFCIVSSYWLGTYDIAKQLYLVFAGTALIFISPLIYSLAVVVWYFVRSQFGFKRSLFVFPFIWVCTEYLLTQIKYCSTWLALGYTQTYDLAVIQLASFTGVFGLSFWLIFINVLIYFLCSRLVSQEWKSLSIKTIASIVLIAAVYLLPRIYGNSVLENQNPKWLKGEKAIRIGVVQPNIDPYKKWAGHIDRQLNSLQRLTDSVAKGNVDLVIWPETSVPTYLLLPDNYEYFSRIRKQVDSLNINLLAGITDWVYYKEGEKIPKSSKWMKGSKRYDIYNTGILLNPDNEMIQKYSKILLVPFAERIPWAEELSFLNLDVIRWNFGATGFAIGKDTTIFTFRSKNSGCVKFSVLICYESVFSEFVKNFVRKGSQFLVVITNDSWWGNTSGVYQHKQNDILRAVENRRWVVRCANGGISCFIDPYGKIYQPTKFGSEAAIARDIQPISEFTFYSKYGDWIAEICVVIGVGLLVLAGVKKVILKKI